MEAVTPKTKTNREIRDLIGFIKHLADVKNIDELLLLFEKQVQRRRGFHRAVLGVDIVQRPTLLYSQGEEILERIADFHSDSKSTIRWNELADRKFLAEQLDRPTANLTTIGLNTAAGGAVLYLEHELDRPEAELFVEEISDRLQPFTLTLDRILLEMQLKLTSVQWERTFDRMRDPIAIIDHEYRLLRSNSRFGNGYAEEKCFQVFAGRNEPCEGCPLESTVAGGSDSSTVKVGERYFSVHSYPIRHRAADPVTNLINHYVDITRQRELFGRLVQSEKMAAIGQLAGHIAHELNNPLTGIRSMAQILLKDLPPDSQLYSDVHEVEKATERSQKIIENLQDFSRGEASRKQTVSLNTLVEKTFSMLNTFTRDHEVELQLAQEPALVEVEPTLLQQVIFNLLHNACQAMTEPGRLTIRTYVANRRAIFEVHDTGPGLSPDVLSRIFEPFFTTKAAGKGTGLGLSLSRSIIESFAGKIECRNLAPTGAMFRFELPLAGGGK